MSFSFARRCAAAAVLALALIVPSAYAADVVSDPQQLTFGERYDRNPAVVVDGDDVWMFFARSQVACDRIGGTPACDPDQLPTLYDLYVRRSDDGGRTFGPSTRIATNPLEPNFRGRTIAATQLANGDVHVFWANGGSGGNVHHYVKDDASGDFVAQAPIVELDNVGVFNVDATPTDDGSDVLLFTQRAAGAGVDVRTSANNFGDEVLIEGTEGKSIPKVFKDDGGTYRMVVTDDSAWPAVTVHGLSSDDGVDWGSPATLTDLVAPNGEVSHWDPVVAQHPDGRYFLFYAPDLEQGAGVQRIEYRAAPTFAGLASATPAVLTTGLEGTDKHWDYWPEVAVVDGELTAFYTSERTGAETDQGTGHIFRQTITEEPPPPILDSDSDGLVDGSDCAPNDDTKPAQGGADANCDGTIDPPAIRDTDGDGIVDGSDCAPNDATRPAEDGADKDCNGEVDSVPQQQAPQQTGGDGGSGTSTGGGTTATATIISLCGFGTVGADLIVCGAEPNKISGLGDDDRLFGGDGNDAINGGNGDDTIGGGGGADRLNGQNHADAIDGGPGNDRISGGSGDDAAIGGVGNDRITGGRGQDVVRSGSGKDVINVRDRRGGDVVSCGSGRDTVVYDRGDIVSRDCERRLRRR